MSTLIEDPAIPLVGMNGKRGGRSRTDHANLYTLRSTSRSDSDNSAFKRFENVGMRLALRKELYAKRKKTCDVSLILAVFGNHLFVTFHY